MNLFTIFYFVVYIIKNGIIYLHYLFIYLYNAKNVIEKYNNCTAYKLMNLSLKF